MSEKAANTNRITGVKEMQTFRLDIALIDRLDKAKVTSRLTKTDIVTDALLAYLDSNYPESAA